MPIFERVKTAWNAFVANEQAVANTDFAYSGGLGTTIVSYGGGGSSGPRRFSLNDRTIITSIYTRMSIDVADITFHHANLDDQGRYLEDSKSSLNSCFTLEPNLDQGPRAFRQDIALTLFDRGCAAIVPVDTMVDPNTNEAFDILTLRVGEITQWYPKHVKVKVYNEATGTREEIVLEKRFVAIVENPLYSVMNEPNSTLQRLIRKLSLLDAVDEQSSSGKLDLIIQLPYVVKSEARKQQAQQRREEIEFQLRGTKHGIAYTDGTEKITQLNRPVENNLLKQIEYLTVMLYGQLGITEDVMNGTADEKTMLNYYNRAVKPIVQATQEAMQRAFVGRRGMQDKEKIHYFRDPFKFVEAKDLAEIADKFTRNEILSSNDFRGFMGIPPSKDPKADQLVNSNMPQPAPVQDQSGPMLDDMDKVMDQVFGGLSGDIDNMIKQVNDGSG